MQELSGSLAVAVALTETCRVGIWIIASMEVGNEALALALKVAEAVCVKLGLARENIDVLVETFALNTLAATCAQLDVPSLAPASRLVSSAACKNDLKL